MKAAKLSKSGGVYKVLNLRDKSDSGIQVEDPISNKMVSEDENLCKLFLDKFSNKVSDLVKSTKINIPKIVAKLGKPTAKAWDVGSISESDMIMAIKKLKSRISSANLLVQNLRYN